MMTYFKKILAFLGSIIIVSIIGAIIDTIFSNGLLTGIIVIVAAVVLFFFSSRAGDKAREITTGLKKKNINTFGQI
ncbi:Uncharacterised protein [Listeria grayi]|uniref:Uncharacterized protein n=1 Tax=Listeria grayi TaxID=1641 RepID=A0A378MJ92_LISGR|nr:Uncharacterised protein [Listeria grayi]